MEEQDKVIRVIETTETIHLSINALKEILCDKFNIKPEDTQIIDYTEWSDFAEADTFAGILLKMKHETRSKK